MDRIQKAESFNTMIPPYANENCSNKRFVYVTELEKDLSSTLLCPSQVMDPCWVDYDEGALMERMKVVGRHWEDEEELMESVQSVRRNGGGTDDMRRGSGYLHHLNEYIRHFF